MKKFLIFFLTVFVCFALQCTVFKALSFANISPDLLLIITSCVGFMKGKKQGMYAGLLCGIIVDIFFGNVFGFYSLLYMYIGYVNGFFNKIFYPEDIKLPMILIGASDLSYNFLIYFFLFLFRGRTDFVFYLLHTIIPSFIYTILVTIILYRILLRINEYLENSERRSNSKFV
ncbi:rod shape-determining protein MreD [Acetitomaculum ruminis DSM 5522]|uniref:Rod shape-determining protein MreD n=1 Tax=Acetitomaculum ruminis DSM 5522 TaxID=1120918 RepID=A0A1I0V5S0_9FIRM|nr:rod shape-determining protein MreD [Acetitomaculum ruminis]SFA71407.1 rod shape-determining protein MreD [Acetitomaculum ruminis DSM 5522]